MFNVTVLKMKDIVKYVLGIFILILIIIFVTSTINKEKSNPKPENAIVKNIEKGVKGLTNNTFLGCLEQSIPIMESINKKDNNEEAKEANNQFESILSTQISSIKSLETQESNNNTQVTEEKTEEQNIQDNIENTSTNDVKEIQTGVTTQVITNNPIAESFNTQYGNVKIKNQTDYQLTQEMMTPDITIENKNIILFHTHSCESYTPSEAYPYTQTGNFRTTDLNFTVTRVGTELENYLKQYNYNVVHSTDYHDYPAYNGSYTKSLKTVENILQTTPSDIIIDIHRDAIGSRSDYAPIVKIGDVDVAAQLMFVIGTNNGGLWHPNWNQNLKFAIKIQEKAEEMYPGLFKPIMLTTSRYNQHTGKYASIIEVGATGNTLEQCLTSMKYLAKVMNEVIK